MKARTAESLFGLFKRKSDLLSKISFKEGDLAIIRQQLYETPIRIGINRGAIVDEIVRSSDGTLTDLRPIISTPLRGDIPTNDIAQRILNDVVIDVVYATPIHYVKIKVGVNLNR